MQRDNITHQAFKQGSVSLDSLAAEPIWVAWCEKDGRKLRLDGVTMDRVLAFCAPRLARRVVAIKGASGQRPSIKVSATKGQRLWIIGTDGEKARLADRLKLGRSIRLSEGLERRFFEELASERRVIKYSMCTPSAVWERIPGRRAEALDCFVYASAVRGLVGVDLTARELKSPDTPKPRVKRRGPQAPS